MANALFMAIGQQLDAGESERDFFGDLEEQLWTGNFLMPSPPGRVSRPSASKARLERLLTMAAEIRQRHQQRLHNVGEIRDIDFKRSLEKDETRKLHNAWMNDVGAWMSPDCLQQYNDLIQEADELDKGKGKGSGGKSAKGVEKGNAGKSEVAAAETTAPEAEAAAAAAAPAAPGQAAHVPSPAAEPPRQPEEEPQEEPPRQPEGVEKGSAGKPIGKFHGPRARAEELKKQCFNKIVSDLAASKAFFMSFVRHPSVISIDSIRISDLRLWASDMREMQQSEEYE